MVPPEIFKYNTLFSLALFFFVSILLIRKTPGFSFKKHTISKSILLMQRSSSAYIFRANFLFKSILDLGFLWYVLYKFDLPLNSSLGRLHSMSILLFATLSYFVEGKYKVVHRTIIYTLGVLWLAVQALLAQLVGSFTFSLITDLIIIVVAAYAYWGIFSKRTNIVLQLVCMSLLYLWLLVFVFGYL